MHHAFPLNDHDWYRLDTAWDWVRLALWCAANVITGAAYFAIPVEIWHWRQVLPFRSASLIGFAFLCFILLCGMSHFAMLAVMATAPWWAILFVYAPMAVVSILTAWLIRRERVVILGALKAIGESLER